MKNQSPSHIVMPLFLSSLFLLLCFLLPAKAQDLTLNANIGSSIIGSDGYLSGTYTVTATGVGCGFGHYDTSDNIHLVYAQKAGDVELVVRVASFSGPNEGQAGLIMRTGLGTADPSASAFYIFNHVDGTKPPANWFVGVDRQATFDSNPYYYELQGGAAAAHPSVSPPFWLKMVKIGDNYGTYWSPDGSMWYLMSNTSGGAFFATGTFDIGLFVGSGSTTTSATATFDNVYLGAPRLKYKTSWAGATSAGIAAGNPSNGIYSMWVKPDGACYTNSAWDEAGQAGKIYKDGKVFHAFFGPGINGAYEGTVTGNGTKLFYYNGNPTPQVCYTDFTTYVSPWGSGVGKISFTGPALGVVGGLAASATRLFVSDITNNCVRVVDLTLPTPTEIIQPGPFFMPIQFPNPGPIAYDGTNFWIVSCASPFPLSAHTQVTFGSYTPCIKSYNVGGAFTGNAITDVTIPTAIAYQDLGTPGTTPDDRLWICDNGPNQNVRYYTNLNTWGQQPIFGGTFGQAGGIWAGSHPGQITDAASGGDQRFYGPVGIGTDTSGNIYVACNGSDGSLTDLRKFDSAGTLQWRQNGLVFVAEGDFDPASDGQDIYLPERHLTMNYANTAPGSEWSYKSFTRNILTETTPRDCGVKLARPGDGTRLYMYTSKQGNVGTSWLYYFNGETAVPFGTNVVDGSLDPSKPHRIWIDTNMNGVVDAGEFTSAQQSLPGGTFQSFDVDKKGDIWMCSRGGLSGDYGSIRQVKNQGSRTLTNGAVVPNYSLNPGGYVDYIIPAPLRTAWNISYDSDNDILYAVGQIPDGTWQLVRCDKWTANPESRVNPMATWAVNVPAPPDLSILLAPPAAIQYMGMDIVGGKIFIAELYGPAHVYDATTGNMEFTLNPGPELSARMGWVDMSMGINAFKRSTGEYLILEDNTGINACDLLYRWTPSADTAVTAAPTALVATAPGSKVVLSWNGPTGMVTSYKLYRGTSSASETLYQSGITGPTFTDLNVTPPTTYYYKVTAVNAAGESVQSNEVSATPLSSAAEFVKTDTTTQGTWKTSSTKIYGNDGYEICNDTISYPTYATVTIAPTTTLGTWVASTTDVRALLKGASTTDRIAAYRTMAAPGILWNWNVNITDGQWHQVAVYMLDWPVSGYPQRTTHVVKIVNTTSGTVLDTRLLGDFTQGKYLVWNITGNVQIQVSNMFPSTDPVASGLFFDPVATPTPALGWWKLDETSGTTASDSSGAGNYAGLNGGTWTAGAHPTPAGFNGCLTFGGTNANSNLAMWSFNPTNSPTITYSMWFKTSTSGVMLGMWNPGPTAYAPVLYVGTDGKLHAAFNTGTIQTMTSTASVNDNTWHHAALTCDGQVQTLYLDGKAAGMLAASVSQITSNWFYFVGGQGDVTGWPNTTGTQMYFNGLVDDMRLYNRVLPSSEIWKLAH